MYYFIKIPIKGNWMFMFSNNNEFIFLIWQYANNLNFELKMFYKLTGVPQFGVTCCCCCRKLSLFLEYWLPLPKNNNNITNSS